MTSPEIADTPDTDPRDDSPAETDAEADPTSKNIHPGHDDADDNHQSTATGTDDGGVDVDEAPLFPPEFGPEDDPYLSARVERLAEPHKDDLVLWVLRHYLGMNSAEMGDYLGVHRTTVRRHMDEEGDDRVYVPYKPLGVYLPRGLTYSDAEREAVADEYEMFVPANDGKPVVVDSEALDEAVEQLDEAMDAMADEFASPSLEAPAKFGVEVHLGQRSLDLSLSR